VNLNDLSGIARCRSCPFAFLPLPQIGFNHIYLVFFTDHRPMKVENFFRIFKNRKKVNNGYILYLIFRADPRSCVVQKIIIAVVYHTFRAKMNHLPAFDMPDNHQPRRVLIAAKAFVRNIIIMKTITFFIMVIHINCLKGF
jgi:hypothetical protein